MCVPQASENKKELFRKYLENAGVIDTLTKGVQAGSRSDVAREVAGRVHSASACTSGERCMSWRPQLCGCQAQRWLDYACLLFDCRHAAVCVACSCRA
jgi:hypothetical protein